MEYFKINGVDFSSFVNSLKIKKTANYTSQTNAAGDTVVDYINSKRMIDVGIIPLDDEDMAKLQLAIDDFNVSISFRNPITRELEHDVNCIIPTSDVDYYTIQVNNVRFNAANLTFTEL